MCIPCGPRHNFGIRKSYYKPHPLPTFYSVEDYLAFIEKNPVGSATFRPLPVHLQNTENFVKVVSLYPDAFYKVPKKYQNKAVKAAAGVA